MDSNEHFTENAKGLTKNPLGIIALFISLIYAFACLVLGTTGGFLSNEQRWAFVIFLIVFPIAILISFLYLVVWHHWKLYAPQDFRNDDVFERLSDHSQASRLNQSVNEMLEQLPESGVNTQEDLGTSLASPHVVPKQGAIVEEPSAIKNIEISQDSTSGLSNTMLNVVASDAMKRQKDLQATYVLAEDLALRAIELELKTNIKRQVTSTTSPRIEFDGVAMVDGKMIGIEVKYTQRESLSPLMVKSISTVLSAPRYHSLMQVTREDLEILIAIVCENELSPTLSHQIEALEKNSTMPVRFRSFSMKELKKQFGIIN